MIGIAKKEFLSLFKSLKSIFIILLLIITTIGIANLVRTFSDFLKEVGLGGSPYSVGLSLILSVLGPLFVFALSHDIVNSEIKSRTIRFLVTKTKRTNIIIGKFLGVSFFWFICIIAPLICLSFYSKKFEYMVLIDTYIYILYFISLCILLSTVLKNPVMSNLIGILVSISIVYFQLVSIESDKVYYKIINFITPLYYTTHSNEFFLLIPCLISLLFIVLSTYVLRKGDL